MHTFPNQVLECQKNGSPCAAYGLGRAKPARWARQGGAWAMPLVARGGALCPTRCNVCWPVRCSGCWRGSCTASEGLCSFLLEFTLFWSQVGYANYCRGTLLYTFGVLDFAPHFPFLWI